MAKKRTPGRYFESAALEAFIRGELNLEGLREEEKYVSDTSKGQLQSSGDQAPACSTWPVLGEGKMESFQAPALS